MRQNKPAGENPTAPRRAMGSTGRKVEWLNGADLLIVRADRKEPKATRLTAGTRCTVAVRKATEILYA